MSFRICLAFLIVFVSSVYAQVPCEQQLRGIGIDKFPFEFLRDYPKSSEPVSVNSLTKGDLVLFRTDKGRYGIIEIQSNDKCATGTCIMVVNWITYNDNGKVYSKDCALSVLGADEPDMDDGRTNPSAVNGIDFWYHVEVNSGVASWDPQNGATLAVINFSEIEICTEKTIDFKPPRKAIDDRYEIQSDGKVTKQSTLVLENNMAWSPGQVINVGFENSVLPSNRVYDAIVRYSKIWEKYANIKLNFVNNVDDAIIIIGFSPHEKTQSLIGRDALINEGPINMKTMNFSRNLNDGMRDVRFVRREILHEFGHALGFQHEHQSPQSGINWNKEMVYRYHERNGWSRLDADIQYIDKLSKSHTNFSRYDPLSIMHYSIPKEFTFDGKTTPLNFDLSETDKKYAGLWYPFPTETSGTLLTGDDCDQIQFHRHYNVAQKNDEVAFNLFLDETFVTSWKAMVIPLKGGNQKVIEIEKQKYGAHSAVLKIADLDLDRPISFEKVKFFKRTRLDFTWPAMRALVKGGATIQFKWIKDSCL